MYTWFLNIQSPNFKVATFNNRVELIEYMGVRPCMSFQILSLVCLGHASRENSFNDKHLHFLNSEVAEPVPRTHWEYVLSVLHDT